MIVWRHGNTDWNRIERVQGQTDTPLNATGRGQAAAAATLLATLRPDAIVSSDLSRAADTAAALAELTGLPVRHDERLRERFFGQWQGLTMTEVAERFPAELARHRAGEPAPGGEIETLDDLAKRVGAALQDAAESTPGGTVVVASHGGAARQGCGALLGWPPQVLRSVGALHNCHWAELRRRPGADWRLWAYNVGAGVSTDPPRAV
ncbi:MAG TPA: histidine phosphatase family protein [Pilimelia sp.]|nr:histidine phosphatase family protein [Pilimelia sp.]